MAFGRLGAPRHVKLAEVRVPPAGVNCPRPRSVGSRGWKRGSPVRYRSDTSSIPWVLIPPGLRDSTILPRAQERVTNEGN